MTFYKPYDTYKAIAPPGYACDYRHGMPLLDGYYIGLSFVPKHRLPAMLAEWRVWMKAHPKSEWPWHVLDFAEQLKRDGKKQELLALHLE